MAVTVDPGDPTSRRLILKIGELTLAHDCPRSTETSSCVTGVQRVSVTYFAEVRLIR